MPKRNGNDLTERVKIQEKALGNMAETLRKREAEFDEELHDVLEELKALKLFLTRSNPDFKKQFPEIRKKVKAA